ncbi:MAG: LD-carboxypeptidase [Acidobacteriota bacterium]|nr:LD-carboxypeptidase [Acidobacteriota bacterium]
MTAPTKPRALRPGATLAILSPASTPKPDLVHQGIAHLHALGYKTILGKHALDRGPLYYAGTLEHRLHDLHAAFANPAIDAILCTRGGWGSAELLPHLDPALIRANPKPFIGYSDHTSLHLWLHTHANLITFYGPMVAADFSREDGPHLASWQNSLQAAGEPSDTTQFSPWQLGPPHGLRTLRPGHAHGTLTGGCLSILAESLGTPYAPRPRSSNPPTNTPTILFLEDIGTKPYQWDRMLLHLRHAGLLEHVTGIVFGDMSQCVLPEEEPFLEQAILHALRDFPGPIAIGLRSGHVAAQNLTLPLGISAALDLTQPDNPTLQFLEAAVS